MLTFLQLKERLRSVDQATDIQRKQSKRSVLYRAKDKDDTSHPAQGGLFGRYIGTDNYDHKVSREVHRDYHHVMKNSGAEVESLYKRKTFNVGDLHTSQGYTFADDESELRRKSQLQNQRHITVVSHTGSDGVKRHVVIDGHHALRGAIARGKSRVRVTHMNLDKAKRRYGEK